ncbi:helix-turn-helix transcriptional regulator [Methylobacterium sp. R2-1]|uniref:helix-turn-helix transcriptional regulator n=1 Tax=Methylobacterium sp. R2-1 TaxID=2587064 RepID=UPI0017EF865D|nr:AraC family transcriptional regulator [Methylobacterium sp. R2-1]MBB2961897.1 AraC-like DNA-binding protein [Methylobacterium sp. R2-1]
MIVEHRFAHIPQDARRGRAWVTSHTPLAEVRLAPSATVPVDAFHRYRHLGDAVLVTYEAPAQITERPETLVVCQALDHVVLRTHSRGCARITIAGQTGAVAPGDIVVFSLGRPIQFEADASVGVDLILPRRVLTDREDGIPAAHGQILVSNGHPLTRLVSDHLKNLAMCLVSSSPVRAADITPPTLALCRTLLTATQERRDDTLPDMTGIAIRRFIEANLAAVDLPMLSARFGLSRASLYRAFGGESGIAAYIRDRRLAAAMRRLSAAEFGRRPMVARLAHECGFASDRVFSRAFHRRFGLWPAEVSSSRDKAGPSTPDVAPMAWLRDL